MTATRRRNPRVRFVWGVVGVDYLWSIIIYKIQYTTYTVVLLIGVLPYIMSRGGGGIMIYRTRHNTIIKTCNHTIHSTKQV